MEKLIILSLILGGGYFLRKDLANMLPHPLTISERKEFLAAWGKKVMGLKEYSSFIGKINSMTDNEIMSVYDYVKNYLIPNKPIPNNNVLKLAIQAISEKYNIFS